jgi:hypothetical protein
MIRNKELILIGYRFGESMVIVTTEMVHYEPKREEN